MSAPLFSDALADRRVTEIPDGWLLRNRDWERIAPGLVAGITTAAAGTFSVSAASGDDLIDAYSGLASGLGFAAVAVPRQVHGSRVETIGRPEGTGAGVLLAGRVDGLVTRNPGLLLASTAADCVPVHLLDAGRRALGLVHAGWRGVVGGILGRGLEALGRYRSDPDGIRIHLGPAICGACYEVDRPVLTHFGSSADRAYLDLRGALVDQALELGIPSSNVTVSSHCTSCGPAELHSHRASGGRAGRMAAFMGFVET